MRISDWSSDVCSSDLVAAAIWANTVNGKLARRIDQASEQTIPAIAACPKDHGWKREKRDGAYWCFGANRSEEHTSELQSLMRISYAVFCLKKKKHTHQNSTLDTHTYT